MCADSVSKDGGTTDKDADQDESDKFWFYVSMGLGFIVGFWAVCGSLAINKSWRHSYFRFLDHVKDKFLFFIAMNMALLPRVGKLEDKVGPAFPLWLKSQTNLGVLTLGGTGISDILPDWFSKFLPSIGELDLSRNNLRGDLSSVYFPSSLWYVNLSFNKFEGSMPLWRNVTQLYLKNNKLSRPIPLELGQEMSQLAGFKVPEFYFKLQPTEQQFYPEYMDLVTKGRQNEYTDDQTSIVKAFNLSRNNVSGEIPAALTNLSKLGTLNLSRSQLTGNIPDNIGDLKSLETLDLSCNHLEGPLPTSMASLTSLSHLNLTLWITTTNHVLKSQPTMNEDGGTEEDFAEDDESNDKFWFYVSMGLGFIMGFRTVCGSLAIKKSWREAYFLFFNRLKDRLLLVIQSM
ncbi:hypothetical protein FEM48_Zijuj10G0034200 [Ziziphus jujuba var. spinosa]|uniref:Receptor-like protein EIX2 n=1 Tax=Ziziphus jujuba var. spinosa TaxID=714518 RepID=A0A978UL07_ZIZJJ|nr:hypothetical protein FEM48_Zijuj10G0034200 [Ziziphus jujuba var. spinosa]